MLRHQVVMTSSVTIVWYRDIIITANAFGK